PPHPAAFATRASRALLKRPAELLRSPTHSAAFATAPSTSRCKIDFDVRAPSLLRSLREMVTNEGHCLANAPSWIKPPSTFASTFVVALGTSRGPIRLTPDNSSRKQSLQLGAS